MSYNVLLVEDDPLIGQGLEFGLESRGFCLVWVNKGSSVPAMLKEQAFDVIVLDLGLPDIDGLTLLQSIRRAQQAVPVIALTARDSIKDRIAGLDSGADDYVIKPASTDELAARIRAVARRRGGRSTEILQAGHLELNTVSREFFSLGEPVSLTPVEYLIIDRLLRNRKAAVSTDTLLQVLEGASYDSTVQSIQVHIHALRKKLPPGTIKTIRGMGYRLD